MARERERGTPAKKKGTQNKGLLALIASFSLSLSLSLQRSNRTREGGVMKGPEREREKRERSIKDCSSRTGEKGQQEEEEEEKNQRAEGRKIKGGGGEGQREGERESGGGDGRQATQKCMRQSLRRKWPRDDDDDDKLRKEEEEEDLVQLNPPTERERERMRRRSRKTKTSCWVLSLLLCVFCSICLVAAALSSSSSSSPSTSSASPEKKVRPFVRHLVDLQRRGGGRGSSLPRLLGLLMCVCVCVCVGRPSAPLSPIRVSLETREQRTGALCGLCQRLRRSHPKTRWRPYVGKAGCTELISTHPPSVPPIFFSIRCFANKNGNEIVP